MLGGCLDYTGAPYFSAIAATLLGADMSHIICEKNAGAVIKTYSPNLMVHPYLHDSSATNADKNASLEKVSALLNRIHVLVVGPGLGRDEVLLDLAKDVILEARKRSMPIVIDADGLFLVQNDLDIIKGYDNAFLTPNVVEFQRLSKANGGADSAEQLAKCLGVTIVQKGADDMISNGNETLKNSIQGGLKRVSGQGDTLSGTLATFLAWKLAYQDGLWKHDNSLKNDQLSLLAAYGASSVTRTASALAFKARGRATLTTDISDHVGSAYEELFEH